MSKRRCVAIIIVGLPYRGETSLSLWPRKAKALAARRMRRFHLGEWKMMRTFFCRSHAAMGLLVLGLPLKMHTGTRLVRLSAEVTATRAISLYCSPACALRVKTHLRRRCRGCSPRISARGTLPPL